jgi:hypothetical protein
VQNSYPKFYQDWSVNMLSAENSSVTVIELVCMKLFYSQRHFIKNLCIEFHGSPLNDLVTGVGNIPVDMVSTCGILLFYFIKSA